MNNATNGTEAPQAQMDYVVEPLGLRIFRLTVYVIIFLLATFGNALVIFVVYKTRELHTGKLISYSQSTITRTFLRGLRIKRIN